MTIYWLLSGLAVGILCAHYITVFALTWVALTISVVFFLIKRKKIAIFALFAALGIAVTLLRLSLLYAPVYGETVDLTLKSHKQVYQGEDYFAWQGKIVAPKDLAGASVLVYSDTYSPGIYILRGMLYPPVKYRNPGQGWHYLRKIYGGEIGVLSNPQIIHRQEYIPGRFESWRNSFRAVVMDNLGYGESASLALALTTGDRSLLGGELRNSVYSTGVGHILALSGLHIGILTGIIMLLLRQIGLSRWLAGLVSLAFLLFYLAFVGPSPSLLRAVLMSVYATAAYLAGRERLGLPALLWSAAAMLLYNPLWLFDYAFVFSFLATFTCLIAGNFLDKFLLFLPAPVGRVASITLVIQVIALPLTLYLFGGISLWSPLANIVIVPLMPLMAAISFFVGIPGLVGRMASIPAGLILSGVAEFLKLLGEHSLSLELGGFPLVVVAVTSAILLLYFSGKIKKRFVAILLTVNLVVFCMYSVVIKEICSIWFLDVGQGDAILIRDRGDWILVDCGDAYAGERAVIPTLKFLGVRRLSAVVITHPHADHVGGLEVVLGQFSVGEVLVNSRFKNSPWAGFIPQARVVRSDYPLADNVHVYSHNISLENENDVSLLVSLTSNGNKVLLTGDIEGEGEGFYRNRLIEHEVLKIAHHGSNSSTSQDFLSRVQPNIAVISCGLGNRYGFPHGETLDRLKITGVKAYRTDIHGCVRVRIWPWQKITTTIFTGR